MGKVTGFMEIDRHEERYRPAGDRIRHFREFSIAGNALLIGGVNNAVPKTGPKTSRLNNHGINPRTR